MDELNVKDQNIYVKNRENINITGVKKIESLNDQEFILDSSLGVLSINGEQLEMVNLNIEQGEISISGHINSIKYLNENQKLKPKENILKKLFK